MASAGFSDTKRPRLLVLAPSAYPLGGVATWLDGFVPGLRARGWELEVGLLAGHRHDVERYLARHPLGAVRRIESRSGSREGRLRALERAIVASRAELVLSVHVGDVEDAVDRLRRRRPGGPRLIVTEHALQHDFYAHLGARAEVVDGVIVTNRLAVEVAAVEAGVDRARVAYAPYGVDLTPARRAPADGSTLRIVWVGRLEQAQKRAGDLAAIARAMAARGIDFRLTIVGAGPEGESVGAACAELAAAGRVRLAGELPPREVLDEIYPRHDVLLVTSSWETGPIVAWEALAAGVAVASSAFVGSGLEGALRHEETALLFPVGDAEAAASALGRLADRALRERLLEAGRREVRQRYTMDASLDAWEAALRTCSQFEPRAPRAAAAPVKPAGRLDRALGPRRAETVRERLGIRRRPATPGDEWPHALATRGDEELFLAALAELDRGARGTEGAGDA